LEIVVAATAVLLKLYFFSKFFTQGWSKTIISGILSVYSNLSIEFTKSLYSFETPYLNLITPLIIFSLISLGCDPVKGALPCTNSYNRIPRDQTSRVWLWALFYIISGAIYSRVPQKVFLYWLWSDYTHHPKSHIFIMFPSLIKMFSGLISRWIRPYLCI